MSRILVVEDNEDHAMLVQVSLSKSDGKYDVDLAKSADDCLNMIQNNIYDAIVLDYSLPKKSGLEILQDMKNDNYDVPIIMMTSHGNEKIAVAAMKYGAYDYVSKFDNYLDKIPLVINKAIQLHEMEKERARLYARVEESEFRLRNLLDNVDAGFIEINKDCKISYINPKAKEYIGDIRSENEAICKIFLDEKNCAECHLNQDSILNNPANHEIEYDNRQLSVSITPLLKDTGDIDKILLVIVDVTNLKRLQQQIIQSERMNVIGRLSSGVAHKFNNVLAIIMSATELMLMDVDEKLDSDKAKKSLNIIQEASIDAAGAVRRLQEFSGVVKQKEFLKLDINEIAEESLLMTEPEWKDQNQYHGINIEILRDFRSQSAILGNAAALKEALTNILFNAIEAMPNGGQLIFETYDSYNEVCISISDNGIGIKEDVVKSIFEPFYTTKEGYAGLGLSITNGIIERHEGKILVESVYEKGSKFIIILPKCTESLDSSYSANDDKDSQIQVESAKSKILAIDDEKCVRELLGNILVALNHEVDIASDGFEGVELFRSGNHNIVITDLGMPGLSGWEVIQQIKAINPDVISIMITGWGVEFDDSDLKEKNVDFIIPKPFRVDQLENIISSALILEKKRSKEKLDK